MKKIIIVLVVFILGLTGCMTTSPVPINVSDSKVIEIPGASKDVLFERANQWVVGRFLHPDDIINHKDKEDGVIAANVTSKQFASGLHYFRARQTVLIEVKDGMARITIKDPYDKCIGDALNGKYEGYDYKPTDKESRAEIIRKQWPGLIDSFEKAMLTENTW
jgi:hypothetical protein